GGVDGAEEFFGWPGFEYVAERAGVECALDVGPAAMAGQYDDFGPGEFGEDAAGGLGAVEAAVALVEAQIHQDDVRAQLCGEADGLLAARRLVHDVHGVGFAVDQGS